MPHPKLIINAAMTGMVPRRADNPNVPQSPDEIATEAAACRAAGASIVHLHARESDESPAYRRDLYREIILAVKRASPDLIICVSTSGRTFNVFEKRSDVLNLEGDAKPEMASLTLGSLNFPTQASVTDPAMIKNLADAMNERGIVPELEIFDMGMLDYGRYLIERKVLREPFYFNLLLGSLGMLSATAFNLSTLVMNLPAGATWAAAGIGRFQFNMNALAVAMGGHVRIGLEDNLYFDEAKQRPATNSGLIERIAKLSRAAEREPATPEEARAMIGLKPLSPFATA